MPMTPSSGPSAGRDAWGRADWWDLAAAGVALGLVVLAGAVGHRKAESGVLIHAGAAPFQGRWDLHLSPWTLVAGLVTVTVVLGARRWAPVASWRALLFASMAASLGWIVSLTLVDGWADGFADAFDNPHDYLTALPRITSLGEFVADFTQSIPIDSGDFWATHVASHPPGAVLPFYLLDLVGLAGSGWAASLCVLVAASAVGAVLVTVRSLADEPTARRLAPFLVLTPAALWLGVSADALFVGVSAWGIALLSLGSRRRPSWRSDGLALAGGVLVGLGPFMSYGLVLSLPIAAGVLVFFGTVRTAIAGALGFVVPAILFAVSGFSWLAGYHLVVERYYDGWGSERPYTYWVWANLAVFLVVIGPAAIVGLRRLVATGAARPRTSWLDQRWRAISILVLTSLLAVGLATVGGLSKGEVERIWLPFAVWTMTACALVPARRTQLWLLLQVVAVLVVQHVLLSPW